MLFKMGHSAPLVQECRASSLPFFTRDPFYSSTQPKGPAGNPKHCSSSPMSEVKLRFPGTSSPALPDPAGARSSQTLQGQGRTSTRRAGSVETQSREWSRCTLEELRNEKHDVRAEPASGERDGRPSYRPVCNQCRDGSSPAARDT